MKLSTLAAAAGALAITSFAASAHAADAAPGWTGELGGAIARSSDSAFNVNLSSVMLRGGYTLNKNFAIEGEASFGVGDDSDSGVKFHQEYEVGIFADGFVPVSENVDLLGRVGYAQTKVKASGFGLTDTNTASGAALGVGLRFFPNAGANGVRIDYTHYFFNKDSAVDGGSITWVHKF